MADVTHLKIDEIEPLEFLEGFRFLPVGPKLGGTPFGMSIIDMPPDSEDYPAHDHVSEGPGNPPAEQLGQEEIYLALSGSAEIEVDGERYPVEGEHVIRIGASARRKIWPGPDGVRLLALSGIKGRAYDLHD